MLKKFYEISALMLVFLFVGCAGSGVVKRQSRVYNKDYKTMLEIVKQAATAGNIRIVYSRELNTPKRMRMTFMPMGAIGKNERGKIHLKTLANLKTEIIIENPEKQIGPNNQKRDYRKYLFDRIDSLIVESGSN